MHNMDNKDLMVNLRALTDRFVQNPSLFPQSKHSFSGWKERVGVPCWFSPFHSAVYLYISLVRKCKPTESPLRNVV